MMQVPVVLCYCPSLCHKYVGLIFKQVWVRLMKFLMHGLTVGKSVSVLLKTRQRFSSIQSFVPKFFHSLLSKLINFHVFFTWLQLKDSHLSGVCYLLKLTRQH